MHRAVGRLLATGLLITLASSYAVQAQESELQRKAGYEDRGASLGSPNTTSRMLVEEDIRTEPLFRFPEIDDSMENWWEFKSNVNQKYGLRFGIDYTTLYQHLSESLTDEDYAWSGILRSFGEWTPSTDRTRTPDDWCSRWIIGTRYPVMSQPRTWEGRQVILVKLESYLMT